MSCLLFFFLYCPFFNNQINSYSIMVPYMKAKNMISNHSQAWPFHYMNKHKCFINLSWLKHWFSITNIFNQQAATYICRLKHTVTIYILSDQGIHFNLTGTNNNNNSNNMYPTYTFMQSKNRIGDIITIKIECISWKSNTI